MSDPGDLRRKAARFRRAASIKTEGAAETDRHLMDLAETLERRAGALEQNAAPKKPPKKPKA
jgi:hypothetical protein